MASQQTIDEIKAIIGEALGLGERVRGYDAKTELLGTIPEFDSMAVVTVLTLVEERFDVAIADDDVDAHTFETIATLADFVETKLAA